MSFVLEQGATGTVYDPYADFPVTSDFGDRVLDGQSEDHKGVDIGAPHGFPARAIDGGVVTGVYLDPNAPGGYGVTIRHGYDPVTGQTIDSYQAHFAYPPDVREGDVVQQGDVIGAIGSTGQRSTGPHAHVELWIGPNAVSYLNVIERGGQYADGVGQGRPAGDPALADGVLERGETGDAVYNLQSQLVHAGYRSSVGEPDGVFGAGTEEAVRRFQENRGLGVDGRAGPATRAELDYVAGTRSVETGRETLVAGAPMYVPGGGLDDLGGPPADPAQVAFVREMDARITTLVGDRVSPDGLAELQQLAAAKGADLSTADVRALLDRTDPGSGVTGTDLVNLTVASRAVGEMQADPFGPGAAAVREARAAERDPSLPSPMDQVDPDRVPAPDTPRPLRMEPGPDGRPTPVTPDGDRQSLGMPAVAYAPEGTAGGRGTDAVQQPAPTSEPMVLG